MIVIILFWIFVGLILYSYIGYTVILFAISAFKKTFHPLKHVNNNIEKPYITLVVAAYNEENNVVDKIENTLQQDYPKDKIIQIWVNDSSTDKTREILSNYSNITVLDQPERKGKMAAINLAMTHVKTPITIFSDANAMLSKGAISKLVEPFTNPKVGCVAGEKRIHLQWIENAAATGEGFYWKYESLIKKLESDCGSTLSATGELYAIRTEIFKEIESDTILDDFAISSLAIKNGYLAKYVSEANACEKASANILEEKKRKVRIAAGSFQVLFRNLDLINPFKHLTFSIEFVSHKLLRWFILPLSIFIIPLLNLFILLSGSQNPIYFISIALQLVVMISIIAGWLIKDKNIKLKWFFIPFYLFMMNISIIQGFIRFIKGKQNVRWDKSVRQT